MGQSWAEGMDVQLRSQEVLACGCGNSLKNSKLWSFVMLCVLERHSWQGMEAALERERREGDRQEMAMTVLVGHGAWLRQRWAQGERCLLHWTDRTRECQLVTISASRMPFMEAKSLTVQVSGLQTYLHWYTLEEFF